MKPVGDGKWQATVELQDDGVPHNWEWGVAVDGPAGKDQWAVMGEGNLKLDLSKPDCLVRADDVPRHGLAEARRGHLLQALGAGRARGAT